jgi:hypothetical protein
VLAPFNSLISLNDTLEDLPFVETHAIKYSKKVREINRVYEQNNNADLDNGVINEAIEQQELEEAALNEASQEFNMMSSSSSSENSLGEEFEISCNDAPSTPIRSGLVPPARVNGTLVHNK